MGDPHAKVTAYRMLIMGANKRLGTDCYDVACLQAVLAPQNRTLGSVLAMPELDSYTYFGSEEMVCSEFAARVWQHGFGSQLPVFQGSEQTPKDNYQFAIYDPDHFDASNCPVGLHTTPNGNYCQLMGQWNLPLKGYNSIVPYANINNHCESSGPATTAAPSAAQRASAETARPRHRAGSVSDLCACARLQVHLPAFHPCMPQRHRNRAL